MDSYQEFLLTVRRDINCLTDADRALRRGAVVKLEKSLLSSSKASPDFIKRVFLEELHKPLFRMFGDQVEKCRELSISMTLRFVDLLPMSELENILPLLLAALLGRLRSLPFPEQSEELRLEALRLLSHLFDVCKELLNPFASDILDALSKALTDTCPDAKKECCGITKKVNKHFDAERVSRAGGPLVGSLLANLKHQQWKVRRATLDSLGALLSEEAPLMDHMEDVLPHLGPLVCDRTPGVRQTLAEVLERWLLKGLTFKAPLVTNFNDVDEPEGFDKFESRLLLLLLSVAADEDAEQVGASALAGLERVAALKHEVRLKRAEKERNRMEARKKAKEDREDKASGYPEASTENGAAEALPETCRDPQVAPEFDYKTVQALLPLPFTAARIPSVLTTTYVQLHLPKLLPQVLSNLTQWTSDIRESAGRMLRIILVVVNRQVAPFVDQVLVHLYKASSDDEAVVAKAALQCAEMIGAFLDADLVLALVAKHLGLRIEGGTSEKPGAGFNELWPEQRTGRAVTRTVQESTAAAKNFVALTVENRRQVFAVLARVLLPTSEPAVSSTSPALQHGEVKSVIRFLEEGSLSDELLPWILIATQSLLHAGKEGCKQEWPRVFDLLLRMRAGQECKPETVDDNMDFLANLLGRSRKELYEDHLRTRLSDLLLSAEFELWAESSPKRHVLETLLRNAGSAVAEHVGSLIPVLARQSSPEDASASARVDLLGLVHYLLSDEDEALTKALSEHSASLLSGVLIPNCTWRAGQSNNKIRKGGMVCIHALLRRHLISAPALNEAFSDLLPILKACLDDSWSPDNRMIACLVLSCVLADLQADINGEQLREVYPELLKRLDDSNDKIRVAVCEALNCFFKCLPANWSRTLYEYILKTLFVHLDDPNLEIQQGIYAVLEAALHQDYATFIKEAQIAGAKSTHPRMCEELARLAESLRKASGEEDVSMD
eukprot:TRINITY_DN64202_c0_g1_i1.p1 TRINITY_DN64202_c0_g1~~TRINITY_DN64202_c0_g1_i1.p1  ORF type:complete len:954 (+),score=180.88 TRINITY_DN64202_c0_g1_i1:112-2973(+)